MRAPPDIKASWKELLREPRAINKGADEEDPSLGIVVREAGLFVELLEREQLRRVDDWGECREAGENEDGEAKQAVLPALVGGMDHDVYGKGTKGTDLIRIGWSVTSLLGKKGFGRNFFVVCVPLSNTCSVRWVRNRKPYRSQIQNHRA